VEPLIDSRSTADKLARAAERIRHYRSENHLSAATVVRRLAAQDPPVVHTIQWIYGIEKGDQVAPLNALPAIAAALGVPLRWLIGSDDLYATDEVVFY
jgi:transcriptional regulator with XRE-family HTH domain